MKDTPNIDQRGGRHDLRREAPQAHCGAWLSAAQDWLMPCDLRVGSSEAYRHARLVVSLAIPLILLGAFYGAVLAWMGSPASTVVLMLAIALALVTAQFARRGVSPALTGNMLCATLFAVVTAVGGWLGGHDAPHFPWYACVPVVAVSIAGWRSAMIWIVLVGLSLGAFYVLDLRGHVFPNDVSPRDSELLRLLAMAGLGVLMLTLVRLYEMHKADALAQLRHAEETLRREKRFSDSAFDTLPGIFYLLDVDGRLVRWNRNLERVSGYAAEEIAELRVTDFVGDRDKAAVAETLGRAFAHGEAALEAELLSKDGRRTPYYLTGRRFVLDQTEYVAGMGIDDTERQRAERSLRESEERYRQLFEELNDAAFLIDSETGRIMETNRQGELLLGRPRAEIVGRRQAELYSPDKADEYRIKIAAHDELNGTADFDGEVVRSDGHIVPVRVSATPVTLAGRSLMLALFHNVTERRQSARRASAFSRQQGVVNTLLRVGLADLPLRATLERCLDEILYDTWLGLIPRAAVFLIENEPDVLILKAHRGLPEALMARCTRMPVGQCLCGRAVAEGRTVFADCTAQDGATAHESMSPHGHYCVPIRSAQSVLGVLVVYVEAGHCRLESAEAFLESVANTISGIVQHRRTADALTEEKNLLRSLVDVMERMDVGLTIQDRAYNIIYQNSFMQRQFDGLDGSKLGTKCYATYESRPQVCEGCPVAQAFADGRPHTAERTTPAPGGGVFYWDNTAHPIRNAAGEITSCFEVVRNITGHKQMERVRELVITRQTQLNTLQQRLLGEHELDEKLRMITDGVVSIFDADFCRIWITRPGDRCASGCVHARITAGPDVCRHRDRCLWLMASSGRYTHLDDEVYGRIPFGCYEIGRLAASEEPRYLTNNAVNDSMIHDHAWAQQLGLVSFAGYQLRPPDGTTIGVLALFATHALSPDEDAMLASLGTTAAQVVQKASVDDEVIRRAAALEQANAELSRASGEALQARQNAELANADLIDAHLEAQEARRRAEMAREQLEEAQRQVIDTSHRAGMAEVATSVLHNVGNVLNSVNVSASLVTDRVRHSKVAGLGRVVALLHEHQDELGQFITADERGRQVPDYLAKLADHLADEQTAMVAELESLTKNIEHIRDIVKTQQTYTGVCGVVETLSLVELLEDAVRMSGVVPTESGLELVREYDTLPPVLGERQKLMQILVNLIRNAKHALRDGAQTPRNLTLRLRRVAEDRAWIEVIDNGIGIAPEHQSRLFTHGFTTKQDGHGFGLHNSALLAREMGAELRAASAGPNQGATFTLDLPLRPATETIP